MNPFVGECRLVAFNFAPNGWMLCQGQILPISGNDALFSLLGTTYGGNGSQNFALPDLRGRVPIHQGTVQGVTFVSGQNGGQEQVTLSTQQMPTHSHSLNASSANGSSNSVQGNVLAANNTQVYVTNPAPLRALNKAAITPAGGNQPHDNLQPYLTMNWIISLFGIFPSRS
jgi:microcystin-dependent protein